MDKFYFEMLKFIRDKLFEMQMEHFDQYNCFYSPECVAILAEIWRNRYNGKF